MRHHITAAIVLGSLLLASASCSRAESGANPANRRGLFNGFDVSNATIPENEIRSGGPPRDGIPSIDKPKFVSSRTVAFLRPGDQLLSVTVGEETRAYPLRILVWHEIVNDTISAQPILVTYCPLCGTAMVFNRQAGGRVLTFGVSGLLYQSDVLMYDRDTQSLWSQLAMKCVAGPLVNTALEWLPSEQMTWNEWQQKYPNGKALSTDTGHARNYNKTAYESYATSSDAAFPVPSYRQELPRKAWVLGVLMNGEAKAYPLDKLPPNETISDMVGGIQIQVAFNAGSGTASVTDRSGQTIPAVKVYWFAWQAFYPQTSLWIP